MTIWRTLAQIAAWLLLTAVAAGHYMIAFVIKGLGYSLPLESLLHVEIMVAILSFTVAVLFRIAGWRKRQAIGVAFGVQAVVYALIVFSFRDVAALSLEWCVAVACLVCGVASLFAVSTQQVARAVRI